MEELRIDSENFSPSAWVVARSDSDTRIPDAEPDGAVGELDSEPHLAAVGAVADRVVEEGVEDLLETLFVHRAWRSCVGSRFRS